jgi:uncharacterized protein with PIN domain
MPMRQVCLRLYAELDELLPPTKRGSCFVRGFDTAASVKDVIEALGVPHTEIGLILINGESVDFSCSLNDGDRISVYPFFRSLDINPLTRVRPRLEGEIRFVLDTHLGKLAAYLRMLGFDSLYRNDYEDEELAHVSASQQRILLSRDRGLLKRSIVTHGYLVREAHPLQQLIEVLRRFDLSGSISPFRRCLHCNASLHLVPKELVSDRLPPETRKHYDEFNVCPKCDRIYWKGSHYQRMKRLIERLTDSLDSGCAECLDRRVR